MTTWQFDLDDESHTISIDEAKLPIVVVLDGKRIITTPLLTERGQAYSFQIKKHVGRIQAMRTDEGLHYVLLIDGKSVGKKAKSETPTIKPDVSGKSDAGIFRRRQQKQARHQQEKMIIRQLIPDWAWVSIIGILFIPAFGRLQVPAVILAVTGIFASLIMANLPHIKEIIRFSYTIMVMVMWWGIFILLASRGIIYLENIPLF